jgi:hypothetical protein
MGMNYVHRRRLEEKAWGEKIALSERRLGKKYCTRIN